VFFVDEFSHIFFKKKLSMRILFIILTFVFTFKSSFAGEGMWLPLFLKQMNEADMKRLGMKINAEDIYSVNKGSLKDAIVHFGGGCTGEVISGRGLLLTNHHCGYGQIQRHSTIENNYLENGFWALNLKDELSNPDLTATFIVRIEDVTSQVFKGIKKKTSAEEKDRIIKANIEKLNSSVSKKAYEDAFIRSFYHGNQYFMFVTVTYKDVRLVGTPPSSIGKFGADTDNWEWPRHTGDFALFRIYANSNNEPAAYSPDNVPYKPKHFLPISLDGVQEGDFTMVFGFPGRTDQYQPSYGVELIKNELNPAKIDIRHDVLRIMDAGMRQDAQTKIDYASKYASIANAYKKWIGENQGLEKVNAIDQKLKYEAEFLMKVNRNKKWRQQYDGLLDEFKVLYANYKPYAYARDVYSEVLGRNSEFLRLAATCNMLINVYENNGHEAFQNRLVQVKPTIIQNYATYNIPIEQQVFASLLNHLVEKVNPTYISPIVLSDLNSVYNNVEVYAHSKMESSLITDVKRLENTLNKDMESVYRDFLNDPMVQLYRNLLMHYNDHVAVKATAIQQEIAKVQQTYMAAQMEVFSSKKFYPDANSTMRVTYGQVRGYKPRDAVNYKPITYLKGVVEKYQPGDYEFDVPKRLIDLSRLKNFGHYADKTGDVPVCFLGSNHTTGGNSGSPAIDANGNLIGLNFDRVWEGTMSDIHYDETICRNIMVDIRYILFIIDKYANAGHLIKEMKLVYPKSGHFVPVEKVEMIERAVKSVD
jgi:hypothetical protein